MMCLQNEMASLRRRQDLADASLQSLLQQLMEETALLQQAQLRVEGSRQVCLCIACLVPATFCYTCISVV